MEMCNSGEQVTVYKCISVDIKLDTFLNETDSEI